MHIESLETRLQFAIGVVEASEWSNGETFFGVPINADPILLRFMLPGDPTLDGKVDRADVRILVSNFNQSGGYTKGDSNYDGFIRIDDFAMMAQRANELAG